MDFQGKLDTILNICRTPADVLHILAYLLPVVVALLISLYRFDRKTYNKYVYSPFLKFLISLWAAYFVYFTRVGTKSTRNIFALKTPTWEAASNRLPYRVRTTLTAVKNFFKSFGK